MLRVGVCCFSFNGRVVAHLGGVFLGYGVGRVGCLMGDLSRMAGFTGGGDGKGEFTIVAVIVCAGS